MLHGRKVGESVRESTVVVPAGGVAAGASHQQVHRGKIQASSLRMAYGHALRRMAGMKNRHVWQIFREYATCANGGRGG